MFAWLSRWGKDSKAASSAYATSGDEAHRPGAEGVAETTEQPTAQETAPPLWATPADTLAWALGGAVPLTDPADAAPQAAWEQHTLRTVDAVLARPSLPADLLPRAPALIPQLIGLLRQEDLPLAGIVERVVRDPLLTTEVMRLARSPHYRTRHPVATLEGAVTVLGAAGLQAAMARVVLRPLYRGDHAGFTGRAAERAWPHASRQAELAADLAVAHGLPRIEGFLAGLLHGSGRTALWRVLDAQGSASGVALAALPWRPILCAELALRSDRFFGQLALEWRITPLLSEAGQVLRHGDGAPQALPPLARVVLESALRCTQELSEARGPGTDHG